MTQPRSKIVNPNVTRWYHCITRCVRQAFLIADDHDFDRKAWIDHRLQELNSLFAVSVAGFSSMDNHFHLLLRMDPEVAEAWTPLQVVQRWLRLYPLRVNRKPVVPTQEDLDRLASDAKWVKERRSRLASLSWFMKCLKEPLSRKVNREENCRGTFFEGRFKSIAILDEESILTVAAYIDLNPVAAGVCGLPEHSPHTSIKERVEPLILSAKPSGEKVCQQRWKNLARTRRDRLKSPKTPATIQLHETSRPRNRVILLQAMFPICLQTEKRHACPCSSLFPMHVLVPPCMSLFLLFRLSRLFPALQEATLCHRWLSGMRSSS